MSEETSEVSVTGIVYQDQGDVTITGTRIGSVGYKPKTGLIIMTALGILLLCLRNLFGYILGIFNLVAVLIIYLKVKDHKVMDVYSDAVFFHHPQNENKVIRFSNDEVKSWTVNKENSFQISFRLIDGRIYVADTYQTGKAGRLLRKTMSKKNAMNVFSAENRKKGAIWKDKK
jgi:hypothetical protein